VLHNTSTGCSHGSFITINLMKYECPFQVNPWLLSAVMVVIYTIRVYFRPLKKGVVLLLAIVKGVELPLEHIKKGSYYLNV